HRRQLGPGPPGRPSREDPQLRARLRLPAPARGPPGPRSAPAADVGPAPGEEAGRRPDLAPQDLLLTAPRPAAGRKPRTAAPAPANHWRERPTSPPQVEGGRRP